jgi:nuclear pore complex protein Nup205
MDSRHTPAKQIALYKFVRLAGDLLMPSLFVPYIEMLAGLADSPASAVHCFNLLKMNSTGSNVSLDHFFSSLQQYFTNLRMDPAPGGPDHTIYRTKPMTRGISPQEVDGLTAVLLLLTTLARRCDVARVCMVEHPSWSVLPTLVGLMSCSVPTNIKAR